MPEQREQVRTYYIDYICDKCGEGKMQLRYKTDEGYRYECDKCGEWQTLAEEYPKVEYV